MDRVERLSIVAEIDLLKRKFDRLIEMSALTLDEADDIEFNAIQDQCAETGNYKPLQDYQRRQNTRQGDTP